jgi:hypothetical protein
MLSLHFETFVSRTDDEPAAGLSSDWDDTQISAVYPAALAQDIRALGNIRGSVHLMHVLLADADRVPAYSAT